MTTVRQVYKCVSSAILPQIALERKYNLFLSCLASGFLFHCPGFIEPYDGEVASSQTHQNLLRTFEDQSEDAKS